MRRIGPLSLLVGLAAGVFAGVAAGGHGKHAGVPHSSPAQVVISRGQPIQIAFTVDTTDVPDYSQSFLNAVRMAVGGHPRIKGFPIQLNTVETRCGQDPNVDADDTAAAQTIVGHVQNVAVLGNLCSFGFPAALSVYQAAGLLALTGSASADWLPAAQVLDRTVVSDGDGFARWYALVRNLPSDLAWQRDYLAAFDAAPMPYADLWFDATNLLIARLEQVSTWDRSGDLVIGRAALAAGVRGTVGFPGVTCAITLDPETGKRVNDAAALARCAEG